MKTHITKIMKKLSYVVLAALIMAGCFTIKGLAADRRIDEVKEGLYRIKAINGNEKGKYLCYKEDETDGKKQLQLTANPDDPGSLWNIRKDSTHSGCYYIYLNSKSPYRLTMDRPVGTTSLYCTMPERKEKLFNFYCHSGSSDYNNLSIRPFYNKEFKFTRTKETKADGTVMCYVNVTKGDDSNNKLWQLEPLSTTITYYSDASSSSAVFFSQKIQLGNEWSITGKIPAKAGMVFTGWCPEGSDGQPDLTTIYKPGQKMTKEVTRLYPVFESGTNTMAVTTKVLNVKASKLKKKKQTIAISKAVTVKNTSGKYRFQIAPEASAKAKKNFKIDKTGKKITVKKGLKKGTYSVRMIVTGKNSAGKDMYQTITLKVKVK